MNIKGASPLWTGQPQDSVTWWLPTPEERREIEEQREGSEYKLSCELPVIRKIRRLGNGY